jgi:hypothetical protein
MTKTGIILASKKDQLLGLPEVWQESDWHIVERDGKQYKQITSFDHYFNQDIINQMDALFETEDEYQVWLNSTDIVPILHIVQDISVCPIDSTLTRKAVLIDHPSIQYLKNTAGMRWRIQHYNSEGVHQKNMDKELEFIATMDIKREFPPNSGQMIGEYEIMMYLMNNLGYKIWEIAISELHFNDAKGLLNTKCNYTI